MPQRPRQGKRFDAFGARIQVRVLAGRARDLYKRPPKPAPDQAMTTRMTTPVTTPEDDARTPPPGPAGDARRTEAKLRRAAALRENLKRRKAQARGRKAAGAEGEPHEDSAAAAQES